MEALSVKEQRMFETGVQLHLPFSPPRLSIDDGVWTVTLYRLRRRRVPRRQAAQPPAAEQLALRLRITYTSRGTRRPCSYPFEMVEYARKLRKYGYFYKEIAEEIQHKFKRAVPWITVRDWVCNYYRMSK